MTPKDKQIIFLELYEPCREKLSRFARSLCYNYDDAKDLISETTLKAFEGFENLNNPIAFTSYLFTICSRIHKRKRIREKLFSLFSSFEIDESYKTSSSKYENYDVEQLYKEIHKMPLKQQESLILFEISGLSLEEIREIQGGSLSGVKSRIKRGREELKVSMNQEKKNNLILHQMQNDETNKEKFEIRLAKN